MAYDVGDRHVGKQHLRDALDIASDVGDDALTAEMLAAMSHQAAFSRRSGEAIDLAIAARRSAARSGAPALHAESFALEAQGLALRRDGRGCISALQRAERAFLSATPENTPQWLLYFDNAYLSAKFAQALRDLGRPADAERFARESLQMSDGYERGRLFNTALLASILADGGQIEEAVTVARSAIEMAGQVRSARARGYLRDVGVRLLVHDSREDVRYLMKGIVGLGISIRDDN
jgi:tetratricopeptide (TPR) repeat protein